MWVILTPSDDLTSFGRLYNRPDYFYILFFLAKLSRQLRPGPGIMKHF